MMFEELVEANKYGLTLWTNQLELAPEFGVERIPHYIKAAKENKLSELYWERDRDLVKIVNAYGRRNFESYKMSLMPNRRSCICMDPSYFLICDDEIEIDDQLSNIL